MTKINIGYNNPNLRKQAEKIAKGNAARRSKNLETLSPESARQLLYELQVHQIELEIQNDELRRAQTELDIARTRYFDLYDLAPVGYFTLSEKGLILEANLTTATLLGITRNALSRKPSLSKFILPEDQDIYYRYRRQLFTTGVQQVCELRLIKKNAAPFWTRLETKVVQDDSGETVCLIVISDITMFKQAEEALRKTRDELEQRVAERTEELRRANEDLRNDITHRIRTEKENQKLQDQLAQARKMESIGRLAGEMAHDFNNLLSVIVSHAELAMMELQPSDPAHKNLHGIVTVTKHSAKLTHQLLAFSRQQAIAPKLLNLNQIIENMLSTLEQLTGKNIALHWVPDINLWTVNMDPAQINQILANLVINARDAIKRSGKVTIETKNILLNKDNYSGYIEFVPGQYVLLTVRDDGCGIDKETLPKIFEPFFTTKKKGKGTGLGLATVYGIIKQNNGLIEVDSKPGKGTTFKIYLPAIEQKRRWSEKDGGGTDDHQK